MKLLTSVLVATATATPSKYMLNPEELKKFFVIITLRD